MVRRLAIGIGLAVAVVATAAPGPRSPRIALVLGAGPLRPGDVLLRDRLSQRGFHVALVEDRQAEAERATLASSSLIVVSSSVEPRGLAPELRELEVPLVVLHPLLHAELGMSSGAVGADLGYETTLGRSGISIQARGHALAAGLSDEVSVSDRPMAIGWATPNQNAVVVATLSATDDRPVFFAYESGSAMVDLSAPARRVGMFVHEPAAPYLTPSAWKLFDAAVDWAAGVTAKGMPLNPAPRPTATPAAHPAGRPPRDTFRDTNQSARSGAHE